MKIRGDFVTNSSSSNFVIFGKSKQHILEVIKQRKVFGEIKDMVVRHLVEQQPLRGDALKKYYKDEILSMMEYVRIRTKESMNKNNPYEWMYSSINRMISKEAGLLNESYLERSVALKIELEDSSDLEQYGWSATGFHYIDTDADDMILVIGINGH